MKPLEWLALIGWGALGCVSGLIHAGWVSMARLERVDLCLFKRLWGIPCPGCGMGHALLLAFQNNWSGSFHAHPFGPVVWGLWTAWIGQGVVNRFRGRSFSEGSFLEQIGDGTQKFVLASLLVVYLCRPWL